MAGLDMPSWKCMDGYHVRGSLQSIGEEERTDIRCNYRGEYTHSDTLCPVCGTSEDTQQHMLVCDMLVEGESLVLDLPEYDDLFGCSLEKKVSLSRLLKKHFDRRKKLLRTS